MSIKKFKRVKNMKIEKNQLIISKVIHKYSLGRCVKIRFEKINVAKVKDST